VTGGGGRSWDGDFEMILFWFGCLFIFDGLGHGQIGHERGTFLNQARMTLAGFWYH
jgi:hypothetical protein